MEKRLLNANQQRRLVTHLRLLQEDLEDIASWRELARPGEPYSAIRDAIGRLREATEGLRTRLGLPRDEGPPLRRRVMATAELWASSMEDVKARHLKAYGHVHPDLAGVLDPRMDEIVRLLRLLADLGNQLPDE
jgi:hypothetical protein